jgi:hemerythrin superfamily protein
MAELEGPPPRVVDLRDSDQPRRAAYSAVRELQPGEVLELLLKDSPDLVMEGAALMVRHSIHWEHAGETDGGYRIRVTHRDSAEPTSVTELLMWDHERLDSLFATALGHANRGELDAAQALVEEFYISQCRHLYAENDVLTPRFGLRREADRSDPTSAMLDEHDNILNELAQIRELLALGDTSMVAPLMAILSGTLAKHEGREENHLFPQWAARLKQDPDPDLLPRIQAILAGAEDDRVPYWLDS